MFVHQVETLGTLLRNLRFETGETSNMAHNESQRSAEIALLNAAQRDLFDRENWTGFNTVKDIKVVKHQDTYSMPDNFDFSRQNKVFFREEGSREWNNITYNFDSSYYNWNTDPDSRPSPGFEYDQLETPEYYRIQAGTTGPMIQLWPRPKENGVLRFEGGIPLKEMVEDSDFSMLDARMIVLMTAYRIYASKGTESAQATSIYFRNEAEERFKILKKRNTNPAGSDSVFLATRSQYRDIKDSQRFFGRRYFK